MIGFYSF
jgi:hypothetical protein